MATRNRLFVSPRWRLAVPTVYALSKASTTNLRTVRRRVRHGFHWQVACGLGKLRGIFGTWNPSHTAEACDDVLAPYYFSQFACGRVADQVSNPNALLRRGHRGNIREFRVGW